jgi:hypothetical protein
MLTEVTDMARWEGFSQCPGCGYLKTCGVKAVSMLRLRLLGENLG